MTNISAEQRTDDAIRYAVFIRVLLYIHAYKLSFSLSNYKTKEERSAFLDGVKYGIDISIKEFTPVKNKLEDEKD